MLAASVILNAVLCAWLFYKINNTDDELSDLEEKVRMLSEVVKFHRFRFLNVHERIDELEPEPAERIEYLICRIDTQDLHIKSLSQRVAELELMT